MKTYLVIIGVTGDLSRRKLLPALAEIVKSGVEKDLEIIGVSRRELDVAGILQASGSDAGLLSPIMSGFTMDLARADEYTKLKEHLALDENSQALIYLSVPPMAATQIVEFLGRAGLNLPNVKVLLEKPFGVDLTSAEEMIKRIEQYFDESQIYRIDHYLAKEMAQNLVTARGGNALFAMAWDNHSIEKIEIKAYETLGIEGRGEFYEQTGALRDVLQGHLMQLLALTIMRMPEAFDWDGVPELRRHALEQLERADPSHSLRAQYEGYDEEAGNPGSQVETFVRVELASRDPLWLGVPLVLATGKAMGEKTTEIRIHFRARTDAKGNQLVFRIQPHEGIMMELYLKRPGYERELQAHEFSMPLETTTRLPDAYEQVLVDAIRDRKSLFTGGDEVLESWRVLQPILDAWDMSDTPVQVYNKGAAEL